MDSFYQLVPAINDVVIRQQRVWCNVVFVLPTEVRDRTPQSIVEKVDGNFVMGFSAMPQAGEKFPYEGFIWEVIQRPIQFPSRYKSKQKKKPVLVIVRLVDEYQNDEDMLGKLIGN